MTMWLVTGQIKTRNGEWHGARQLISFSLDGSQLGITDVNHARALALEVVNPLGLIDDEDVSLCVVTSLSTGGGLVKTYLAYGDTAVITLPYSEVCMHMRVAGTAMKAELFQVITCRTHYGMVQLYSEDGSMFSDPITTGEAGIYQDARGYYYYPEGS